MMCLLIYKPKNKLISAEALRHGFENNPDGAGFSIPEKGKIKVLKGFMTFGEFLEAFKPYEKKEALIHFRIGTSGKRDAENCHPFSITERLALAHNGIFHYRSTPDQSDTACLVEDLRGIGLNEQTIHNRHFQNLIQALVVESHSRAAIHWTGRRGESRVWLINEATGSWVDGIWFSNSSWKESVATASFPWLKGWKSNSTSRRLVYRCPVCREASYTPYDAEWFCSSCFADADDLRREGLI